MAKRRTSGGKPTEEKKAKRAKVEKVEDPIEMAVAALLGFLHEAESVPAELSQPIGAMLSPLLSTLTEDRQELEQFFAVQIGRVMGECVADVDQKVSMTAEALATAQADEVAAAEHVEVTLDALTQAETVVASTQATFEAATETATAADGAVVQQKMQVLQLDKNKKELEREAEELVGGLELLQPDAQPSAKDTKKLLALLKQVGSKAALLDAIPSALGCTEGFGLIVVTEGQKMLLSKHQEVTARLGEWDEHCVSMQAKSDELAATQQVAAEALTAAGEALTEAQTSQQAAKATKKGADSKLVVAKKKVTSMAKNSDVAGQEKENATEAQNTYQMLFTRTEIPVEAETVETEEVPTEVMAEVEFTPIETTELAVEASVEPVVEAPVEPVVEAPVEPAMEAPVEPAMEAPVEPVVEAPVEVAQVPEPVVEVPVEQAAEPPTEVVAEPVQMEAPPAVVTMQAEPVVSHPATVVEAIAAPELAAPMQSPILPSPRRSATTMPTASPLRRASVEPVDEEMPLATEGF